MKNALLFSLVILLAGSCKHQPDPDPATTFAMNAWVNYTTNPISIQLHGSVFRSMAGPSEIAFDNAEIFISENQTSGYQSLSTTSQTSVSLPGLKAGASYYIQVKGTLAGQTADSKPILVVNDVVQPVSKLLSYDPLSYYYVSPTKLPIIQQRYDYSTTPAKYMLNLIDASGTSQLPAYIGESRLICIGWKQDGQRAFFQTTRSNERALVQYDLATKTYSDLPLPSGVRLWNYALSPDGQQVVFTDYSREGIWLFDRRTNAQKKIDTPQTVYGLTWTANSERIWVTRPSAADRVAVVQYDPQTGSQSALLEDSYQLSGAQVSADGKFVLYTNTASGRNVLWVKRMETGITRPVGMVNQYGWLNDGSFWAAYQVQNENALTDRESFIWSFKP